MTEKAPIVQYEDWVPAIGDPAISKELIIEAEARLGFKIPEEYIDLLWQQNGGYLKPNRARFGRFVFRIGMFYGLGLKGGIDSFSHGEVLNRFLIQEWGYPENSLVICHDRHGGFALMLGDKRPVVYCDAELPTVKHFHLADSLAEFVQKIRYV